MTPFQWAGAAFCAGGLVSAMMAVRARKISRRVAIAWVALWTGGLGAILWPDGTTLLARTVGIGRGADLVLYVGLLAAVLGFFVTYRRLRRLETDIALLVRRLALEDHERHEKERTPPP